nr:hypothetical protein [Desulfobacteraceae bacterium]
ECDCSAIFTNCDKSVAIHRNTRGILENGYTNSFCWNGSRTLIPGGGKTEQTNQQSRQEYAYYKRLQDWMIQTQNKTAVNFFCDKTSACLAL